VTSRTTRCITISSPSRSAYRAFRVAGANTDAGIMRKHRLQVIHRWFEHGRNRLDNRLRSCMMDLAVFPLLFYDTDRCMTRFLSAVCLRISQATFSPDTHGRADAGTTAPDQAFVTLGETTPRADARTCCALRHARLIGRRHGERQLVTAPTGDERSAPPRQLLPSAPPLSSSP
jgi:hypothetical protein